MLGSGALVVLTIGAISVYGLTEKADLKTAVNKETKAANVKTTTEIALERENRGAYTSLDTVTWRKASINDYEIAEVSAAQTTKETAATTQTTTKETETQTEKKTTTTAAAEKLDNEKMVANDLVNLREENSRDSQVLAVIDKNEVVIASEKTADGWYAVSYDGIEGYVMEQYLEAAPKATTAETTTTTAEKTTTTKQETTTTKAKETTTEAKTTTAPAATTTPAISKSSEVISYTDDEFEMLTYVLEGEVGNCSEASKIAVANVIINRVKSSQFPNSISGVLTAADQFTAIYGYYNRSTTPSQNTIDCAKRALEGEDNTNGATFYYAPQYCGGATASWFESLQFCFEIDGQRYFKNW